MSRTWSAPVRIREDRGRVTTKLLPLITPAGPVGSLRDAEVIQRGTMRFSCLLAALGPGTPVNRRLPPPAQRCPNNPPDHPRGPSPKSR